MRVIMTQSQGYKTVQLSFESGIHLLKNMISPAEGKTIGATFLFLNPMPERQRHVPSECDTHHTFKHLLKEIEQVGLLGSEPDLLLNTWPGRVGY